MDDKQLYYKEKYFKYKLKYLTLKEQLGGLKKSVVVPSYAKSTSNWSKGLSAAKAFVAEKQESVSKSVADSKAKAISKSNNAVKKVTEKIVNTVNAAVIPDFLKNIVSKTNSKYTDNNDQVRDIINTVPNQSRFSFTKNYSNEINGLIDEEIKKPTNNIINGKLKIYNLSNLKEIENLIDAVKQKALDKGYISSRAALKDHLMDNVREKKFS
jgi:hypothetical protein